MQRVFLVLVFVFTSSVYTMAGISAYTTYIHKTSKTMAYIYNGAPEVYSYKDGLILRYDTKSQKFTLYNSKADINRKENRIDVEEFKAEKLIKFLIARSDDSVINRYKGLSKYCCNDIELFRILTKDKRANTAHQTLKKETKIKGGEYYTRVTDGEYKCSYHIYFPTKFKSRTATNTPLIIAFSPGGDGQGIMKNIISAAEKNNCILIGCDYLRNGISDYELEVDVENEILDDIFNFFKYDKDILIYAGFSGGAMRSYGLSVRRSEKIYGILAMGGWLGGPNYQDEKYQSNMRIAMANGSEDRGANGWQPIDAKTLEKYNSVIKLFPFEGKHQPAPEDVVDNALEWILFMK